MIAFITAAFLLGYGAASGSVTETERCTPAPALKLGGLDPIKKASKDGNITVVALLDAKCGYCILQATLLKRLKEKFDKK